MRKIAAHYIFTGHTEFIKNGVLTLDDHGTIADLSSLGNQLQEQAGTEFYNGILVPGFVNTHCHLELSHMKGALPTAAGMTAFCKGIMNLRSSLTEVEQQNAMRQADEQMQAEGIVAVGDISNTAQSFAVKQASLLHYHTFVECFGLKEEQADTLLQQAQAVAARASQLGLSASLTPHAPYSMSERLFAASVKAGEEKGVVCIHNQESADEQELFATKNGSMRDFFGKSVDNFTILYTSPLQRVLHYIAHQTHLLLVHNTYTSLADYQLAASCNDHTFWILCPRSNLYIENRLPDVRMLHSAGARIALGTDSLSSNTSLSILEELKVLSTHFPDIGLKNLLQWATLNGAQALGCDKQLGSFDIGKSPGICLLEGIDFNRFQLTAESRIKKL